MHKIIYKLSEHATTVSFGNHHYSISPQSIHKSGAPCYRGRPLVSFPWSKLLTQMTIGLLFDMVPVGLEPSTGLLGLIGYLRVVTWSIGVRELPPPTPREAYLPQRPECAHERGNDGDTEQAQWPIREGLQDKAESREEQDPGDLTEKEAEVRVTPKSLTRLRRYRRVSTQYI